MNMFVRKRSEEDVVWGGGYSRGFFNAPVLSGWWQAASLSLALCLWSDWYEKNYRSAMGRLPLPSPTWHAPLPLCSQSGCPLRPTVMERKGWCEKRGNDGGALQRCPSGQTSLHPPSQQDFSSPHNSIYAHPSIYLITQLYGMMCL